MHKLIPYYEREIGILRRSLQDLGQRYPSMATILGLSGEQGADPAVEHVMQGTALLAAHISRGLDYYHTRWTADLLGIHGPFYLHPVPYCSVVEVQTSEKRAIATVPRGTELSTKAEPACHFRTAYDLHIPSIAITASYTTRVSAPLSLGLPADAGGEIIITIESQDMQWLSIRQSPPGCACALTPTLPRAPRYMTVCSRARCAPAWNRSSNGTS